MKTSSKYITATATGNTREGERNDCAVRALSNATGCDYSTAHALFKKQGRKDRKGVSFAQMLPAYAEQGMHLFAIYGDSARARILRRLNPEVKHMDGMTLGNFMQCCGDKEYIVIVTGHAVAVKNNQLIDTYANPAGKRVCAVFVKNT